MKRMEDKIAYIPVEKIVRGRFQTRAHEDEDEIEKLAQSMDEIGLINPIVVRAHPKIPDRYEVACGHRRLQGAKILGWKTIQTFIRSLDDRAMAELGASARHC